MRVISILTGLLTLTVAIFSFTVSFVSLENISRDFGFPIPFLFPLTVEAGVVIFSLNALYRSLNREKTIWQWTLVILSSCLALTFNVLHAQNNLTSQVMFAIPSLFFLLAFENLLSQVKYVTKKNLIKQQKLDNTGNNLTLKQQELNKAKKELGEIKTEIEKSKKVLEEKKDNRLNIILDSIKNDNLRINDLAKEFEVSNQTIYNDVKKLEKVGTILKNGKGWIIKNEQTMG